MRAPLVVAPSWWLALAIAGFLAAAATWQGQRLDRIRPQAADGGVARQPGTEAAASAAVGTARPESPQVTGGPGPGPTIVDRAELTPPPAPTRQADPAAGRVVLRCVVRGQVTYKDVNAGCPEGASERVTVFPTEGVGKPK